MYFLYHYSCIGRVPGTFALLITLVYHEWLCINTLHICQLAQTCGGLKSSRIVSQRQSTLYSVSDRLTFLSASNSNQSVPGPVFCYYNDRVTLKGMSLSCIKFVCASNRISYSWEHQSMEVAILVVVCYELSPLLAFFLLPRQRCRTEDFGGTFLIG